MIELKTNTAEKIIQSRDLDPEKVRFILTDSSRIQTGTYIVERFEQKELQRLIGSIIEILPKPQAADALEQLRQLTKALSFV